MSDEPVRSELVRLNDLENDELVRLNDLEIDGPSDAPDVQALEVQPAPPPEGVQAVMQFLRNDPAQTPEESAARTLTVILALGGQRQRLKDAEGVTIFLMGGCIDRLKRDERWKLCAGVADYWTFGAFCREMLGLSLAYANALQHVWKKSQAVSLLPHEIEELGWNASSNLLRVAKTRVEVTQWLEVYKQVNTRTEFVERLKRAVRTDGKATPKYSGVTVRTLRMSAEEARFYDETLERVAKSVSKELHQNMGPAEAVLLICTQWMLNREQPPPIKEMNKNA